MTGRGPALWLRLALRELRGGTRGFWTFLACLALGVAAVAGTAGLAESLKQGLARDAKRLLGGDLEVRRSHLAADQESLALFRSLGRVSATVRMRAMAGPETGLTRSGLVELKAVDRAYPLYGEFRLRNGKDLGQALALQDGLYGAVADPAFLVRAGLAVGDRIRVGGALFRLAGVIEREPDKASYIYGLGPRLMISLDALDSTGLARPGSVAYYGYRIRTDRNEDPEQVRETFRSRFPGGGWRVRDLSTSNAGLKRNIDNMALYLTLVSLAALLLGGVGAAGGVRGYLRSRDVSIAAMKCLGATRAGIVGTSLAQVLCLALLGVGVGVAVGALGADAAAGFLGRKFGLAVETGFHAGPAVLAAAYGLLTALAFALPPISAAARVSPARLFRGYADPGPLRPTLRAGVLAALALAALLGLAVATAGDKRSAWGFAVAVPVCGLAFLGLARGLRALAAGLPRPRNPRLAHALANLHRPGAPTAAVVFSLGLGLTALAAVTLVEGNMQKRIRSQIPEAAPSYFFLDIPDTRIGEFRDMVRSTPGVTRMEAEPSLRGRIVEINGAPAERAGVHPDVSWAIRGDRALTYATARPEKMKITAGRWWPPDYNGPPAICLAADLAKGFGVGVGDTLTLNVLGREIKPVIRCLREVDWATLALNHAIVFAPGVLEKAPHAFLATAYADNAGAEEELFRRVAERFPEVAAVYLKDVLDEVAGLVAQIGWAVRGAAGFVLLAGLLVLSEALRANLRARHMDAVVFKVLGATRRDVLTSLAAEFGLLGAAAALASAVLGSVASWLFVTRVMRADWSLLPGPLAVVVLGGVGATLALGLLGVRKALSAKAWPVLRNE